MSLYAGDMSSRILGGEKIEDVLKNPNVDGGGAKPLDWNGTSDRDLSVSIKPTSEVVKYAPKEVYSQDSEDKFWRSLGFTQSDMIKPKHKGRFYLAVVLVAGYFAYKKFKK